MKFSKRIKTIVSLIKYETVADIGCDHGYISIWAALGGNAGRVIACDKNKGPLLNAERNIARYGLSAKITTRLADGLSGLRESEAETIIIAGLGGGLIAEILEKDIEKTKAARQLILAPQSNVIRLRKFIGEIGLKISDETITRDKKQYYSILNIFENPDNKKSP
jgi:tRNA (adenine22-N1)-methyltransferase